MTISHKSDPNAFPDPLDAARYLKGTPSRERNPRTVASHVLRPGELLAKVRADESASRRGGDILYFLLAQMPLDNAEWERAGISSRNFGRIRPEAVVTIFGAAGRDAQCASALKFKLLGELKSDPGSALLNIDDVEGFAQGLLEAWNAPDGNAHAVVSLFEAVEPRLSDQAFQRFLDGRVAFLGTSAPHSQGRPQPQEVLSAFDYDVAMLYGTAISERARLAVDATRRNLATTAEVMNERASFQTSIQRVSVLSGKPDPKLSPMEELKHFVQLCNHLRESASHHVLPLFVRGLRLRSRSSDSKVAHTARTLMDRELAAITSLVSTIAPGSRLRTPLAREVSEELGLRLAESFDPEGLEIDRGAVDGILATASALSLDTRGLERAVGFFDRTIERGYSQTSRAPGLDL